MRIKCEKNQPCDKIGKKISQHNGVRKNQVWLNLKARLYRGFALPTDTNDQCRRFLHWNIHKKANAFGRCKRALKACPTDRALTSHMTGNVCIWSFKSSRLASLLMIKSPSLTGNILDSSTWAPDFDSPSRPAKSFKLQVHVIKTFN